MELLREKKMELIRRANEAELSYVKNLADPAKRKDALEKLHEVCTEEFIQEEILLTYAVKLEKGEHVRFGVFPVPKSESGFTFNDDGSVSFVQCVYLRWTGGQVDDFTCKHTYYFLGNKISKEEPSEKIRRKAKTTKKSEDS